MLVGAAARSGIRAAVARAGVRADVERAGVVRGAGRFAAEATVGLATVGRAGALVAVPEPPATAAGDLVGAFVPADGCAIPATGAAARSAAIKRARGRRISKPTGRR